MASSGINDGGITKFSSDGVTGTFGLNTSWTMTHSPRETTNKDTTGGKKQYKAGLLDVTGSAEFYQAEDSTWNLEDAFDAILGRLTFVIKYSSGVAGDIAYQGTGYFTDVSPTSPNTGESETFTVSWLMTGGLNKVTLT